MKRMALCLCGIVLVASCGHKPAQIDRAYENGVEIVRNHLEAYRVQGVPSSLHLERKFSIDTERSDLAEKGVADIWGFTVDSLGNIYIFKPPLGAGDLVSKFDSSGRFLASFAPKGQGPREIQWPGYQAVSAADELPVLDLQRKKLLVFDGDGAVLRETDVPFPLGPGSLLLCLPNGNYLFRRLEPDRSQAYPGMKMTYVLVDGQFKDVRELDQIAIPHPLGPERIRIPIPEICWAVAGDRIYMGNPDKGYEISVFDLAGNLLRKITKEFRPAPFPESRRQEILKAMEPPYASVIRDKLDFAKACPPFQHIFCDDEGRLYVMTYEIDPASGGSLFDIFTPDGVFVARTGFEARLSADPYGQATPLDSWITARKGRLYAISEKPDGYKELVAYRMTFR